MESSLVTGRRVAVGLVILAGIGLLAGYGMAMRAQPEPTTVSLEPTPGETNGSNDEGRLFVHVGGAVASPGLYELSPGARINDALAAAGGPTTEADVDAVNLAASVSDGDKVLVPRKGEAGAPAGVGADPGAAQTLVNINTAPAPELESLPGIGPALAQRIITFRTERGGFRAIEELLEVSGIGPKIFEGLRDMVTV